MMRVALFALLAACSFEQGSAFSPSGDGGPGDGRLDASRASDAKLDANVSIDGKIYMDAPTTVTGSLSVTLTSYGSSNVNINLSTEGTTDWAHWGLNSGSSFDHKVGSTAISNLAAGPAGNFSGAPLTSTWNNGTPDATANMTSTGVYVNQPNSMVFTAPADRASYTLNIYVGTQDCTGTMTIALSDGSAGPYTRTVASSGTTNYKFSAVYNAATDGNKLTVTWTDVGDGPPGQGPLLALLSATLQ